MKIRTIALAGGAVLAFTAIDFVGMQELENLGRHSKDLAKENRAFRHNFARQQRQA
jgi:hypothetical protein